MTFQDKNVILQRVLFQNFLKQSPVQSHHFWVQKFHMRFPFLWNTSDRNNFLQTCWTTVSCEFLVSKPILLFICSVKLDTMLLLFPLLWKVAWITTLQCDKIKVFCLHMTLPGMSIQSPPRLCFCCSSWNNAAFIPVVLISSSSFKQKQSNITPSTRYAAASEGINQLTPQSSCFDTYPVSQLYSAKFKTNYMFKFWSLREVEVLCAIGP